MTKKRLLLAVLFGAAMSVTAQDVVVVDGVPVDQSRMPGWTPRGTPDYSLMTPWGGGSLKEDVVLPDHLNNVNSIYFPPRFNQSGGSCGPASRIGYMLTHELNAYRGTDASLDENRLPPNFVYPFSYDGSSKDVMAINNGVPNMVVYGGFPYSSIYGFAESDAHDAGWMTGYEKWYHAMFNRLGTASNFPTSTATTDGAIAVKRWLLNHNGDESFMVGGVLGLGCSAGSMVTKSIASTEANRAAGVVGKAYVDHFGTTVDHAVTLVGWDDRVEFDLDANGVYGEERNALGQNERGAWIIVNSWGAGWGTDGQAYVPYATHGPTNQPQTLNGNTVYTGGEGWWPEIYRIRKDYVPQRTVKARVSYTQRSCISISAGVSANLNATKPDRTIAFHHYNYQGDADKNGTAEMIPMLGKWGDGQLHYEPIEFGYDLTDLCNGYDMGQPLKFFFIVTSKSGSQGVGGIHGVSIMDYTYNPDGVEVPFTIEGDSVTIVNGGKQTMLSVIVNGSGTTAPVNVSLSGSTLSWEMPANTSISPKSYKVYANEAEIAEVTATSYTFEPQEGVRYSVRAVFDISGNTTLSSTSTTVTKAVSSDNEIDDYVGDFTNGGFSIPDVFANGLPQATIEYRIKPNSLTNWNQQIGPNWGSFLIHTTSAGEFVVGWNTDDRISYTGVYTSNRWKHVAIVVDGSSITAYVNGTKKGTYNSTASNGIPSISDFVFGSHTDNNSGLFGQIDEVRVWNVARTSGQIRASYQYPLLNPSQYSGLLAYYKMDTIDDNGEVKLRDCVGGHHASFVKGSSGQARSVTTTSTGFTASMALEAQIVRPSATTVGTAVTFEDYSSPNTIKREWVIDGKTYTVNAPTVVFTSEGTKEVSLTVTDSEGNTDTAETTISVGAGGTPTAAFHLSSASVSGSDRISFISENTLPGCTYLWEMPGAKVETATTANASAEYEQLGSYTVRLTVITPDGQVLKEQREFDVTPSAPIARYNVGNAVVIKGQEVHLTDNSLYAPTSATWTFSSDQYVFSMLGLEAFVAPTQPGVYNLTYKVANEYGTDEATQVRALVVCNADSKQALHFGGGNQQLKAQGINGVTTAFSIGFWLNPLISGEGALSIKAGDGLTIKSNAEGGLTLTVGSASISSNANVIEAGAWHSFAITATKGTIRFYKDGNLCGSGSLSGVSDYSSYWNEIVIGGEAGETTASIDELWVFSKLLAQSRLRTYIVSPLTDVLATADASALKLYYDFNHTSGDALDQSGANLTGVRTGFGPDGDAWVDSRGVFALNFSASQTVEPLGQKLATSGKYSVIAWSDQETSKENSPATNALDGSTSTFWHTSYGSGNVGYPHSITIQRSDLTDVETLKFSYTRASNYRASEARVEVSEDGETWTLIDSGTSLPDATEQYLFLARPVHEPYIRITFTQGFGGTFLALNEIGFYGGLLATGISEVEAARDAQQNAWYDLQGRRIFQPTHGVYIRGGEKVYVK